MISKEMQAELAKLARAANRRLERASEGQLSALMHYISGYHTRESAKGLRFMQGKAQTEAEYRQRMEELDNFLYGDKDKGEADYQPISTRAGWKKAKSKSVANASKTLNKMGYDITDNELAAVLEELPDGASSADYYRALENVIAKKKDKGRALNRSEIIEAISSRRSDYEATLAAIKARK